MEKSCQGCRRCTEEIIYSFRSLCELHSLIQRYMDELPGLQKALQERQASYTELLHAKDMTESEWKPLTEEYSRQMADQLQKETDTWKQKKIAAQTVKDSTSKAIDGRTKPDLELAKAQMEEAEVKRDWHRKNWIHIKNNIKQIRMPAVFLLRRWRSEARLLRSMPSWKLCINCCLEICPVTEWIWKPLCRDIIWRKYYMQLIAAFQICLRDSLSFEW